MVESKGKLIKKCSNKYDCLIIIIWFNRLMEQKGSKRSPFLFHIHLEPFKAKVIDWKLLFNWLFLGSISLLERWIILPILSLHILLRRVISIVFILPKLEILIAIRIILKVIKCLLFLAIWSNLFLLLLVKLNLNLIRPR